MKSETCNQSDRSIKNKQPDPHGTRELKLEVVGNTAVGKSSLTRNLMFGLFEEDREPTALDVFHDYKNVGGRSSIMVEIHDTSGDDLLGVNRKVQYQDTDCFMICVVCSMPESFDNIGKWKAEIKETQPINRFS